MDTDWLRLAAELALGLAAGILSGIMGLGGGVVLIPGMVFLFGVPQHVAQGVSLAVIVPTAVAGATTHYRQGNVALRLALLLAPAAMVGSVGGAWLAGRLDAVVLRQVFGILLLFVSARLIWTRKGEGNR